MDERTLFSRPLDCDTDAGGECSTFSLLIEALGSRFLCCKLSHISFAFPKGGFFRILVTFEWRFVRGFACGLRGSSIVSQLSSSSVSFWACSSSRASTCGSSLLGGLEDN